MVLILLKFLKLVLWPNIWCLLKHILPVLEKNVYTAAVGWNVLNLLGLFDENIVQIQCFFIDCLSGWSVHCWKWAAEFPYSYCVVLYFSLKICYYLLNIFRCSAAVCICIYNCCIYLMYGPFVFYYSFWLKDYFVWWKYTYPYFLLMDGQFFLLFHCNPMHVLEAEVSLL